MKKILLLSFVFLVFNINAQVVNTPLAGKVLDNFPWFQYVNNFQTDEAVYIGLDPNRFSTLPGQTVNVYIIEAKTPGEFEANPQLVDVRGASQLIAVSGTSIQQNIFELEATAQLGDQFNTRLGVKYDIVIDSDNNGMLSFGDYIDGWDEKVPGFYKLHNTFETGPYSYTVENYFDADQWLDKRIYYPEDIESMGELPLVIVSHGWTYTHYMYDFIGEHLASYGYLVVIHANNVGAGGPAATHSASLTTLDNTDHFIGEQNSILSGIFEGHIDESRIAFLGHSTGGEGIVRAYTRVLDNVYTPDNFELESIKLLCPFAPTAWLTNQNVDPDFANFHMFSAGADADCSLFAAPENGWQQSFSIFERSKGNRQLTYIYGAGHTDLNGCENCNEFIDNNAPNLIGKENTHKVILSYLLPLVELYLMDNSAGKEYFSRMYDDFHPIGIPENLKVAKEYKQIADETKLVIDDYQTNQDLNLSSAGLNVDFEVDNIFEIEMRDNDNSFNWTGAQQSNGFSRSKSGDDPRCVVLDWGDDAIGSYSFEVPPILEPLAFEYLSFRACQGTRHPNTVSLNDGLAMTMTLVDDNNNEASISTSNYGLVNQPYQRSGGWTNEFETIIIRLKDFAIDQADFNVDGITTIRFEFGNPGEANTGRLAIDDVELIGATETFEVPFAVDTEERLTTSSIILFPNPVHENLILRGLNRNSKIVLTNNLGQVLKVIPNSGEEVVCDMKEMEAGIYYVQVSSGQGTQLFKVVKF